MDLMKHIEQELIVTKTNTVIMGDFSLDPENSKYQYQKLLTCFMKKNLKQTIKAPTTIYGSVLDLVFIPETMQDLKSSVFSTYYSDHSSVLVEYIMQQNIM